MIETSRGEVADEKRAGKNVDEPSVCAEQHAGNDRDTGRRPDGGRVGLDIEANKRPSLAAQTSPRGTARQREPGAVCHCGGGAGACLDSDS